MIWHDLLGGGACFIVILIAADPILTLHDIKTEFGAVREKLELRDLRDVVTDYEH